MSKINEGENEPLRRNEKIAEAPERSKFQQLMPQVLHFLLYLFVSLVSLNPTFVKSFCVDRVVIMRCIVLFLHWLNSRIFGTRCSINPGK